MWVQIPRGANYFGSGVIKLFSTAYTVIVSSTGAILMEPIKLIITHNVDAQLSYRTGVGSNLTRPQCLSMYISMGDAMLGRSDTKLGVLGVSITTYDIV